MEEEICEDEFGLLTLCEKEKEKRIRGGNEEVDAVHEGKRRVEGSMGQGRVQYRGCHHKSNLTGQ